MLCRPRSCCFQGQACEPAPAACCTLTWRLCTPRPSPLPPPRPCRYARLHTTLGDLNLELHADLAPATVENWLALAEAGYYNGTAFHRSIRNFMIQVGRGAVGM